MPKQLSPAQSRKREQLLAAVNAMDWPSAVALSKPLLARSPDDPNVLFLSAVTALHGLNQPERAYRLARKTLKIAPDHNDAAFFLHDVHLMRGDKQAALEVASWVTERFPFNPMGYYFLATHDVERALPNQGRMEDLAASPSIDERSRAALFTGLGLVYERRGRLDAAMTAFLTSKRFRAPPYLRAAHEALLQANEERYTRALFEQDVVPGLRSDKRPVFIVGMPRSGSSLIDRVVSSHSQVSSAGERMQMSDVLRADFSKPTPGLGRPYHPEADGPLDADDQALKRAARAYLEQVKPYVGDHRAALWVDKMPANLRWCGAVMRLFPDARIIMTDREPRDVMLSGLRTSFTQEHDYIQSFEAFAHYYAVQQRFTSLWSEVLGDRLLVVRYEELVGDLAAGARRILAHLDLPWEDACAQPEKHQGAILTASAAQVREPVHSRSVGGWRKFERQFAPLTALLEQGSWGAARAQAARSA